MEGKTDLQGCQGIVETKPRVRQEKSGLAQARTVGLHVDENKQGAPEGLAPSHRQGGRHNVYMRAPIPGRQPYRLRLPSAIKGEEGPPGRAQVMGGSGRPELKERMRVMKVTGTR